MSSAIPGGDRCPWCTKKVYFAERTVFDGLNYHAPCLRNKEKQEKETKMTFSISEQIFCNPEGGERVVDPSVVQEVITCGKCGHKNFGRGGFCIKCRTQVV